MAINYNKVGWDTTKYFNPSNMNHMDDGIKAACDKADTNESAISSVSDRVTNNEKAIEQANSNLVKTATITGTTNTGGGIFTGLSANEYIILGAVCENDNDHRIIVTVLNHNWLIPRDYETLNMFIDREFTITYCYIKR